MFDDKHSNILFAFVPLSIPGIEINQLCTVRTGFPILVTVRLYCDAGGVSLVDH